MEKPTPNHEEPIYAILLAGGSGTRLWPLSRTLLPKQLLSFDGEDTLLQQTAKRLMKQVSPEKVLTVTNGDHRFEVQSQLRSLDDRLTKNILLEPEPKNTLPAIAWAVSL